VTQKAKTKPQPKAVAMCKPKAYNPRNRPVRTAWHWSNDQIEIASSLREGRDNGFFEAEVVCENPF
jgi:hypothetical protein